MEFWAAVEGHKPAYEAITSVRRAVEPYLNIAFSNSGLDKIKVELRYVPIVMLPEAHKKYTERSTLMPKERVYVCAPHLNYELFVSGSFEEQLQEYLRGIALSAPHLAKLGANEDQIKEFEEILKTAQERIPLERPDMVRH